MKAFGHPILSILILGLVSCTTSAKRPYYLIKVQSGDTLSSIAMRYGTTWQNIAADNGITDYRKLRVDQVLRVQPGPGGFIAEGSRAQGGFMGMAHPNAKPSSSGAVSSSSDSAPKKRSEMPRETKRQGLLFGGSTAAKHEASGRVQLKWPLRGPISSYFGPRWGKFHHGIDIRAKRGTPITAAAAGKVIFSGWKGGYGRTLIIDHGNFQTLYGHCRELHVRKKQSISRGQTIATVGSSGNASGNHLHFEVRNSNGMSQDPLPKLPAGNELLSQSVRSEQRLAQGKRP